MQVHLRITQSLWPTATGSMDATTRTYSGPDERVVAAGHRLLRMAFGGDFADTDEMMRRDRDAIRLGRRVCLVEPLGEPEGVTQRRVPQTTVCENRLRAAARATDSDR